LGKVAITLGVMMGITPSVMATRMGIITPSVMATR
jgi:hypothetical protein